MNIIIALIFAIPLAIVGFLLIRLFYIISRNHFRSISRSSITIQDWKGNILIKETLEARDKQRECWHDWILTDGVYECPKCLSSKSNYE